MGKIELDHTGSGSGITLSSDGTDLLLDGTAIGGGGGSPDLYAEDYDGTSTKPSVTGTNSVAIGTDATASSILSLALGPIATASGTTKNTAVGYATTATGSFASALGGAANANGQFALALSGGDADGNNATAINRSSSGSSAKAQANGAVAIGGSYSGGIDSFAAVIANNTSSYGATGDNSVAIGSLAKATGTYNVAIGREALADGAANAFAFGRRADAGGAGSLALGLDSTALGTGSIAIGKSYASGTDSLSAGIGTESSAYGAQHEKAVALGYQAVTTAANQIALGSSTTPVKVSGAYTLPTSDGTNGQVLTTDGSGAVTFADAGGGSSLELYAENPSSATTPLSYSTNGISIGSGASNGSNSITRTDAIAIGTLADAQTTRSIAIGYDSLGFSFDSLAIGRSAEARGSNSTSVGRNSFSYSGSYATALTNSYASGADSFAAAIANNTSSYGATGTNSVAIGQIARAISANTVALGGTFTYASGSNSVSIGKDATTFGARCFALNGGIATSADSMAIGNHAATKTVIGHIAMSGGFRFSAGGDSQQGTFILRSDTTDATSEALTTNNSTAGTTNQIILPNNSAYSFSGTIIARESAAAGSDYASWEIKGALLRDANAASTVLGNGIKNKLYASAGASAWDIALTADTTNGGLKIEVTGAASTNIRWVATVNTSEVTYA